jgi:hypothetical protein
MCEGKNTIKSHNFLIEGPLSVGGTLQVSNIQVSVLVAGILRMSETLHEQDAMPNEAKHILLNDWALPMLRLCTMRLLIFDEEHMQNPVNGYHGLGLMSSFMGDSPLGLSISTVDTHSKLAEMEIDTLSHSLHLIDPDFSLANHYILVINYTLPASKYQRQQSLRSQG